MSETMPTLLKIDNDRRGHSVFEELQLELGRDVDGLSTSLPFAVSSAWVFRAPAGGGHPPQPEARRQLAVVLAGSCTVTVSSGETRTCRPGDLLLVEDTEGEGHSSASAEGSTILMIALDTDPRVSLRTQQSDDARRADSSEALDPGPAAPGLRPAPATTSHPSSTSETDVDLENSARDPRRKDPTQGADPGAEAGRDIHSPTPR